MHRLDLPRDTNIPDIFFTLFQVATTYPTQHLGALIHTLIYHLLFCLTSRTSTSSEISSFVSLSFFTWRHMFPFFTVFLYI